MYWGSSMETDRKLSEAASILALLVSEPDEELVEALHSGELYSTLATVFCERGVDLEFLLDTRYTLEVLTELYHAAMAPAGRVALLPVESLYKQWTNDTANYPGMVGKKGYLMSDAALHMIKLYEQCGIEVPDGFNGQPDHLTLELEFLSILYENGNDLMVHQFIKDHLDWIPDLIARWAESQSASFYLSVFRIVDAFIIKELSRLELRHEVNV